MVALWQPTLVSVGMVGYVSKPNGKFITLLNSLKPTASHNIAVHELRPLSEYGPVDEVYSNECEVKPDNRRKNVERKIKTMVEKFKHKKHLDAPKNWFKSNVDRIVEIYGQEHQIQKEDLCFVIGTLTVSNYAMFVSRGHPDGQVHFDVHSSPTTGDRWGKFITNRNVPSDLRGPDYYDEPFPYDQISASKISPHNKVSGVAVLLSRLHFLEGGKLTWY
ncbi:hypothetical protein H0H81_012081 [Sphagnurus paluster]|uniref:Uncharacterized protein n=1 Tax=Sphagnurus paluster TaxID=117069 RepID=A0A9P7FN99_9AGAR|nr:hypothetical protein H0H81_012081 [Sphagnurus paluster]